MKIQVSTKKEMTFSSSSLAKSHISIVYSYSW